MTFYTAKTAPINKDYLLQFRLGSSWIYAESFETYIETLISHAAIASQVIDDTLLVNASYYRYLMRATTTFLDYESQYLNAVVNYACKLGLNGKLLCKTFNQSVYACYYSKVTHHLLTDILNDMIKSLKGDYILDYDEMSENNFGGEKGTYFWAKSLCEHLVNIGIAKHHSESSIRI